MGRSSGYAGRDHLHFQHRRTRGIGSSACHHGGIGHELPRPQSGHYAGRCPLRGGRHLVGPTLPRSVSSSPGDEPCARTFRERLGPYGSCIGLCWSSPPVAFSRISDLYHAPGATPVDQATLVLLWQATQGIFNETDTMGFVFMNLGIIVLGLAMLKAPSFGKIFGGVSVVLGVSGLLGISLFAVDSVSFAPFAILAFMFFPLLFGWKVYRLSKAA